MFGSARPPEGLTPAELRQRLVDKHPEPISRLEALEIAYAHLEASDRPEDLKAADVIDEMIDEIIAADSPTSTHRPK
jgi:hypothetical protein